MLLVVIVALLGWFVFRGGDDVEESVEEVVVEEVTEEAIVEADVVVEEVNNTEQIDLVAVDGSGSSGIARRGTSGDLFSHVVVATLPEIDTTTHFYEGWLVKPGVVEFFSTGDMFPREDGKWGLVWEASVSGSEEDLYEYSKVVITLEPRDNDPAPSIDHIIEGEF